MLAPRLVLAFQHRQPNRKELFGWPTRQTVHRQREHGDNKNACGSSDRLPQWRTFSYRMQQRGKCQGNVSVGVAHDDRAGGHRPIDGITQRYGVDNSYAVGGTDIRESAQQRINDIGRGNVEPHRSHSDDDSVTKGWAPRGLRYEQRQQGVPHQL
jgi:hypothetical protein